MTVFLVLLEFPALVIGTLLARHGERGAPKGHAAAPSWPFGRVLHEVFAGKSIVLLLGGLAIGWLAGPDGIAPLDRVFFDLFKGLLAFFLLEMGLVAASRIGDLRRAGVFLFAFATLMPLAAGGLGLITGQLLGLSVGGITLLATLYASASYIAAPAAMPADHAGSAGPGAGHRAAIVLWQPPRDCVPPPIQRDRRGNILYR